MVINYDKAPSVEIEGYAGHAHQGYPAIVSAIRREIMVRKGSRIVLVIDCYPGVREDEVTEGLCAALQADSLTMTRDIYKPAAEVERIFEKNITDDRVFGVMSHHSLSDFCDTEKLEAARQKLQAAPGGVHIVLGVGASLVAKGDMVLYADLARWEIQQRYRSGELGNLCADNAGDDRLRLFKRGYFVDWRVADRHKKEIFQKVDFFLDTNRKDNPAAATGDAVRAAMAHTVSRPFRVVPYFDAGVWGGHWMRDRFDLPENGSNYAWCFDCVPEENSLYIKIDGVRLEFPSVDLVYFWPDELLGKQVRARFGTEFPIRFDMLDTMGGQNLSLQVHPLTEYIQDRFGMHYTQDESYYVLDCNEGSDVYLGLRNDADPEELLRALREAQGGERFPAEDYVNKLPAHKHDHFSIPAGTVHCSGADTMVLEISATPYIFTFKLWDWDRLGMDGLPRPVHLDHGEKNIQFDRRTDWVKENCALPPVPLREGDGWREERTGLQSTEFIETRRRWFTKQTVYHTRGNLQVMNLVEGEEAIVESPSGAFHPFHVHYAETFIIPAQVGEYTVTPVGTDKGEYATIQAFVRIGEDI